MSKNIIVSTSSVNELINSGGLCIVRKSQKIKDSYNYFFSPVLQIDLYGATVSWRDAKHVVFRFDKYANLGLLTMLRNVSERLLSKIKHTYIVRAESVFNIHQEQENTFTIRCGLVCNKGRYNVKDDSDGLMDGEYFKLPRIGCCFEQVSVEIRNAWEDPRRLGFNIELKRVKN